MKPSLRNNKVVGVVSPSSPTKPNNIPRGIKKLESLGYEVQYQNPKPNEIFRYLASHDEVKVEEIHQMFSDENIDIIISRNGGYGTPRIVNQIDYNIIKNNPKVFSGFSDITLLLNTIYMKTGLTTYHGPMLCVDFSADNQETHIDTFFKAIRNEEYAITSDNIEVIKEGKTEGILVGGNLSLLNVFVALDVKDYFKDKILLIEELNEPNYRLDRMLQTLKLKGVFEHLKGVIIGGITGDVTPQKGTIEIFKDVLKEYNYPVLFNAPIGHVTPRFTVPIGGRVSIDTAIKTITVLKEM